MQLIGAIRHREGDELIWKAGGEQSDEFHEDAEEVRIK
jgi:hypothetical protein